MAKHEHLVFGREVVTGRKYTSDPQRKVTFAVTIDLDLLARHAIKASYNKGRKSKDGALIIEIISIEPA